MNIEFGQFIQTFAIGALAVLDVFLLFPEQALKLLSTLKRIRHGEGVDVPIQKSLDVLFSAMFFALVFATGVFLEDFSKAVTSDTAEWIVPDLFPPYVLPRERTLRIESLHKLDAHTSNPNEREIQPLLHRLFRSQLFRTFGDKGEYLQDSLLPLFTKHDTLTDSIICTAPQMACLDSEIIALYYQAHNRVYREPKHFDELTHLESRLDFARSLTFLSACLIYIALAHLIWHVIVWFSHKRKKQLQWRQPVFLLIFFFLTWALGFATFKGEQRGYNVRIFGYFESLGRPNPNEVSEFKHNNSGQEPPAPNTLKKVKVKRKIIPLHRCSTTITVL